MVFEMLFFSLFNHVTWLMARENFIILCIFSTYFHNLTSSSPYPYFTFPSILHWNSNYFLWIQKNLAVSIVDRHAESSLRY
jgi:hypothetical protein